MDTNKPAIIVALREYYPLLYAWKEKCHPSWNVKFLTPEEVLDRLSISFAKDPLPFLLSHGMEYNKAKKYEKILRVAKRGVNASFDSLYEEMERLAYFTRDALGIKEFQNRTIYLFERNEDRELPRLLFASHLSYMNLSFQDLDGVNLFHPNSFVPYPNKYRQYFSIFSSIRERLKNHPEDKERIRILVRDASDLFYLDCCSSLFQLPCYYSFSKPFLEIVAVQQKMCSIHDLRSLHFQEEELANPDLATLHQLIVTYDLETLASKEGFDYAYLNLLEIVQAQRFSYPSNDRGILVVNDYSFDPNAVVYVTNFQYGDFYRVYANDNVFTDRELEELGVNPSYVKTKLDARLKKNYLERMNIALLSRPLLHLQDHIYDSPFVEENGIKADPSGKEFSSHGSYSASAQALYLASQYDAALCHHAIGEYRSYSHAYQPVDFSAFSQKQSWSITNLETYYLCPFAYYLNAVIPSVPSNYYRMWLGTFIHAVFENAMHRDASFEEALERGRKAYRESVERNRMPFTGKEAAFLELAAMAVRPYWEKARGWRSHMNAVDCSTDAELPIEADLTNPKTHHQYHFKGRIDKIVWTKSEEAVYYTIVDYKSGVEKFDYHQIPYGRSLQLPFYAWAIAHLENEKSFTGGGILGGWGISTVGSNTPPAFPLQESGKDAKICGAFLEDESYWAATDKTGYQDDGKYKASTAQYLSYDGSLRFSDEVTPVKGKEGRSSVTYAWTLQELEAMGNDAILNILENIERANFPIAPTSSDLKATDRSLHCKYCPYLDICYHSDSDKKSYQNAIRQFWKKRAEKREGEN